MAIDIGDIIRQGYDRTIARNGLQLAAVFFVLSVLDAMFSAGVERRMLPSDGFDGPAMGPVSDSVVSAPPISLGLSPAVAGLVSFLLAVVTILVTIGALRTFVTDETESLPRAHFTEDVLWPALNLIVGAIVFGIAVAIGFVLLVVPGLFLLVSLFFWEVFVAVEDDNFVEGFQRSWAITSGRRLRMFALGVVVLVVAVLVSIVFAIPDVFLPAVPAFLLEQVGAALIGVFFVATITETYNRLVAGEATDEDASPVH
jgi:hypothetical protein